jgi:uncharacterized protein (TIGR02246 family)
MTTMTSTSSGIQAEIRRANDQFEQIFAQGDSIGMASLYTTEGMLLPTGSDMVKGREAIRSFWQMVMDMGVKGAKLETVEVDQQGETAIELGQYLLSGEGGQRIDQGKYIVVWKMIDGQWKLHKDIWNTSLSNT